MQEGDPLSFCPDPRHFVNQPHSCLPAFLENSIDIVDGEADVMDAGPAARDKFSDRRAISIRFEKFDERPACIHGRDTRSVGILHRKLREAKYLPEKRKSRRDRFHGDSNVGDTGALRGFGLH